MLDFWDVLIISAMVHETHIINFAIEIILSHWITGRLVHGSPHMCNVEVLDFNR